MVRTRLTAAEPYTSGRLEVVVDLAPDDTVAALEAALTGLPPSEQTKLWIGGRELPRDATVRAAGVRDGVVVSVGGPIREPRGPRGAHELRVVSGPEAGLVFPLPEGESVVGGPGSDVALGGVSGERLLLKCGPTGVAATSLDADKPVRRAGVALQTTVSLTPGDQLEVGPHLLDVSPVDEPAPEPMAGPGLIVQVDRPWRDRSDLGTRVFEQPVPPSEPATPRLAVVPALVLLALGLLLGLTVSTWLLALVLLAPAVVFGKRALDRRRSEAAYEQEVAGYDAALADLAAETSRLTRAEVAGLRAAAPDPVALLRIASGADGRVWERRRTDDDRLVLRVGTSSTLATSWRLDEQPALLLHDIPVTVPLRRAGALGITGIQARAMARWLVAQAAALHGPDDLAIWLLSDPEVPEAEWDWLRWLPHNLGQPEQCANLVGNTEQTLAARIEELKAVVAERRALSLPGCDVLVVVDGAAADLPGVAELLRDGPSVGVFSVCVAGKSAPKPCRTVIALADGRLTITGTGALPVRDVRADLVSASWADQVGRSLSPLRPADAGSPPLPAAVPLSALLADEPVEERWRAGRPAPVGMAVSGPVLLDLAGTPHVLLTGADPDETTGLLQTVVTSLALSRSPEALSLVLVGDGHGELADLPHVSSTLTVLEGSQAARVLASLSAELRRRQTLLASVGAADIDVFAAHGSLPRLVLVLADAADLHDQLPTFLTRLVTLLEGSGRLGVHAVLSTSRPTALPLPVVGATSARLALRLPDAAASERVLGSPVAASVLASRVGRGYARFGSGAVVPFQAAALTEPTATGGPLHPVELPWAQLGQPLAAPGDVRPALPALVRAMRTTGLTAQPSPWLAPLPDRVVLDDLEVETRLGLLPYGLEDLPGEQVQRPAVWDLETGGHLLVAGASRSGRSTLLLTLAASLARSSSSSDVHLYAIDCGNGALRPLAGLPHCGAVVAGDDADRIDRLLTRLTAEVGRRQRQLAERGFSDLAAQRKGTADPLPYLLVLIDGWEGFFASVGRVGDGRLVDALVELLRDGGPAGLRVVLTGDRTVLTSDVAAVLPERLVLRLDEPGDYDLAGLEPDSLPARVPAGRAFRARLGETLPAVASVQIALLATGLAEIAAGLPPARGRKPFRVDVLPGQINWGEAQQLTRSGPGAPLAVGGDELKLQTVNLLTCGPGFTIAGPRLSGRSTALVVLARSLLEAGTQVCLVTPAPSPLAELRGAPGVLAATTRADELRSALDRAQGAVAVLVDDADQLADEELASVLQEVLRQGRARDHAVVVAGDTEQLAGLGGGFAYDARRSRSGLLLTPASLEDGDLLGVRLQRSAVFDGPPGRGLLVRSGDVQLVQVPQPE